MRAFAGTLDHVQVGEDSGQFQFGGLPAAGGSTDVNGSEFELQAVGEQFAQV